MLLRPISDNKHDVSFMEHISVYHPDIIICIATTPDMDEMYNILSHTYQYYNFFSIDTDKVGVIFSRYPVNLKGIMLLESIDANAYNITVGPEGEGINIVYVDGSILSGVSNLSEFWFTEKVKNSFFYVDHEYMVARNLEIISQGDEQAMRHPDMKIVYYSFRIKEEAI